MVPDVFGFKPPFGGFFISMQPGARALTWRNANDPAPACLLQMIRQAMQRRPLFRIQHALMKAAHDHCP
jgi:hypothetical protein